MKFAILLSLATLVAGCVVGSDDPQIGDTSGNEDELTVNEIVQQGEKLVVKASSLNLRASGSTSAAIVGSLPNGTEVTCAATSGGEGWVNITTAAGATGWVFGRYVVRADASGVPVDMGGTPTPTPAGSTCAASRAGGVITSYQRALHDSIAFAEGTRNHSKDGYDVMFSYRIAGSCQAHPNTCIKYGSTCSTAAGRYQFLSKTWKSVAAARNLGTFEPENQERGAAYLISTTRRVSVPQSRAMTATEFSNAMSKLSYEWASLPPGRYGQPNKTLSQMRSTYCSIAGC